MKNNSVKDDPYGPKTANRLMLHVICYVYTSCIRLYFSAICICVCAYVSIEVRRKKRIETPKSTHFQAHTLTGDGSTLIPLTFSLKL